MKEVHFNASTIEALMESLYELNKKLLVRERVECCEWLLILEFLEILLLNII